MKTLDLTAGSGLPALHPEELRRRAKAGHIPGAKVGRAGSFMDDDLAAYVPLALCSASASVASDTEKGDRNVTSQTRRYLVDRRRRSKRGTNTPHCWDCQQSPSARSFTIG